MKDVTDERHLGYYLDRHKRKRHRKGHCRADPHGSESRIATEQPEVSQGKEEA